MICRKCKKEIPDESAFCMYCGQSQAEPKRTPKKRGNGQGTVFKRGKTYTAMKTKHINGQKKTISQGGFRTKSDAIEYLPKLKFDEAVVRRLNNITFKSLYDEWSGVTYTNMSYSRQTALKKAYERCKPLWDRPWRDLIVVDMQTVVNEEASTFYPRRDMRNLMSMMAKHAIENDYFDKNYAQYIKLPELIENEIQPFEVEEILAFWNDYQAGNDFSGYIITMIFTGTSIGEILKIETENIFLDDGYMLGGIKTKKRKQSEIIIPEIIKPVIERLAGEKNLVEMSEETFRKKFDEACIRAKTRPLKPHSCRHTYATQLSDADVQSALIKEMARHTNYKTTLRYTHVKRKAKQEAADKMANLLLTDEQQETETYDKQ